MERAGLPSQHCRRHHGAMIGGAVVALVFGGGWIAWGLYFIRGGRSARRGDRRADGLGTDPILRYTAFGLPNQSPRTAVVAGVVTVVIGAAIALLGVALVIARLLVALGLI